MNPVSENDDLHQTIQQSKDKLFFIQYTPDITLRPRWYLIQVYLQSTLEINPNYQCNHQYWCVFQTKHSNGQKTY